MRRPGALLSALLSGAVWIHAPPVRAVDLPPTCTAEPAATDDVTPLAELRARVEAAAESDPASTVPLMCAAIPRVAREYGEDSVELAWWLGSLAMPLIAYMDRYAEAGPLLEEARSILERRLGPDAVELADVHVADAWIAFRQGLLADCSAAWERALRIREIFPGPRKIELQKVLVGRAQTKLALRDFDGARESLSYAYAILEENGETVSEAAAAIHNAFANLAWREEKYAEGRDHAQTQIDVELQLEGGAPQLVTAYALLGKMLERLDEFEESERAVREAVRLSESAEGPLQRHQLAALTHLAGLLVERGKPAEALPFVARALEIGEATLGVDAPKLVVVLSTFAEARRAVGELPEALHLYERVAGIVERHGEDVERQTRVAFFRGLGELQLGLGELDLARQTLDAGLGAAGEEPTLSTERALVLLGLAEASRESDDERSRTLLLQALELFRARLPESHPTILRVINELCEIELARRQAVAANCEEGALRLDRSRELPPVLRQAVHDTQSRLAEQRGDLDGAHALASRALAAAAALGAPDPLWRAHFRLAHLLNERDERKLAIFFGKQAITQIERLRGSFVGEDRRLDRGFLENKVAVYRAVADWLMETGRIDEGLEVLRLLKDEELYDFVLRDASWRTEQRTLALTDDEQALWERFAGALDTDAAIGEEIDRLSRLEETGRISPSERARLTELLVGQGQVEVARAERIREFIARGSAGDAASGTAPRVVQAEELERALDRLGADSALAVYLLTDTHLRVLVATEGAQIEYRTSLNGPTLRRDIGRLLDGIAGREEVRQTSRALYDLLVRQVADAAERAGARRLVLWLDGALRYLPFAALYDGERYLAERFTIESYAEADGAARGVARSSRTGDVRVRGLGVTRAVAGYPALPAVADELCSIIRGPITGLASQSKACTAPETGNGALSGAGFADTAFTEARFRGLLDGPRDFSVLHLGTHFSLRPGNAVRSFLVLGDGSKLTLDVLRDFDFTGIELLTLSACQTGLGGAVTDDGREVEGLSTLVQRRGARQVVASLWHVEDASTSRLMHAMYRALQSDPADASLALQQAQRTLRSYRRDGRNPYEHPYYWAGFVLSGSAP